MPMLLTADKEVRVDDGRGREITLVCEPLKALWADGEAFGLIALISGGNMLQALRQVRKHSIREHTDDYHSLLPDA